MQWRECNRDPHLPPSKIVFSYNKLGIHILALLSPVCSGCRRNGRCALRSHRRLIDMRTQAEGPKVRRSDTPNISVLGVARFGCKEPPSASLEVLPKPRFLPGFQRS
jgi:hypothetical protein